MKKAGKYDGYILENYQTQSMATMAKALGCNAAAIRFSCRKLKIKAKPHGPRIRTKKQNSDDRAIWDLYAANPAAGEKFLSDVLEEISKLEPLQMPRKIRPEDRPKPEYNQGSSYIKLMEKYQEL